jgi:HK97 family phage major capsid protein
MNPRLKALHAKLEALHAEGAALDANESTWDEAQSTRAAAIPGEIDAIEKQIGDAQSLSDRLGASREFLNGRQGMQSVAAQLANQDTEAKFDAIKNTRGKTRFLSLVTKDRESAQLAGYRFGQFLKASMSRNAKSIEFCKKNGIPIQRSEDAYQAGHTEGINEDGGFLVPAEFENLMIDLREEFGVFRQRARISPMASDTKSRPRRKSGLTAYFVGEADDAAESKKGWDRVNLTAKKLMVLTKYSSELGEDATIGMGDDLAGEISYAFSQTEDTCGFIGTGISTHGGIVGVAKRLLDVYTTAGGVGCILGAGNNYSELTLANFQKVVGALPKYADGPGVAWYCHKVFFYEVMVKLAMAAGGVPAAEIVNGIAPRFMGYPVIFSQVMPKAEANSQIPVTFGNLALAADFGDRRATTIAMSEHADFDTDEIAVRGTERFDINVHSVGDATNAGPIVGLMMAAS